MDLGFLVWRDKRPPHRKRASRSKSGEGGFIYIPLDFENRCGRDLISYVGLADARRLAIAFGGEYFFFPSMERAFKAHRDRAIAAQVRSGVRLALVACGFGISERQVRRIVQQESNSNV